MDAQPLVGDLTLEQFQAIPRAEDQELVTSLGRECLKAWRQDSQVSLIFDLSRAREVLTTDKMACVEMPVMREVFEPSNYDPEGAIYVAGPDYILVPQYPSDYLREKLKLYKEFLESAKMRMHFDDLWLVYDADQAMGATNRVILLDKNFVIRKLKERDFSGAAQALERLLSDECRRSYYLTTIAEELAHAVIDSFTRGAEADQEASPDFEPDFLEVLHEGMASGLSLRALTLEDLDSLYSVTDHKFLLLSSLFFQELIDSGLLEKMREPIWGSETLVALRKIMIKIYGSASFDPHKVFDYCYPPPGRRPADWLKGLRGGK